MAVHSLPLLQPGQDIQICDKKVGRWQKSGTVLGQVAPRSYSIQTQDGGIYRCNRQALKTVISAEKHQWKNLQLIQSITHQQQDQRLFQ